MPGYTYYMNPFYIGLPALILSALCAYGLHEKGIGRMSAEQIGMVTLALRADRIKFLVCSASILVVYFALRFGLPGQQDLWFLSALAAGAAVSVYFEVRACRSVVSLVPQGPARTLVASGVVGQAGLLCLLGAMATTAL